MTKLSVAMPIKERFQLGEAGNQQQSIPVAMPIKERFQQFILSFQSLKQDCFLSKPVNMYQNT
jgi:hypothetical protein